MSTRTFVPRPPRLQRSELAVPATSARFFQKAADGAADAIFIDLEDAVADARKVDARTLAIQAINSHDWRNKTLSVRVNGLDTPWGQRDILELATHCPRLDMILLPKAGCAFDVRFVDQLLIGVEHDTPRERPLGIEVLIETAQGVAYAEEIASASNRLEAMIFGVGDFTVDMRTYDRVFGRPSARYAVMTNPDAEGRRDTHWNDQWHFAQARIAAACRANGLRAIDGPFTDFGDPDGYTASAQRAAALGFEGKWAIHPSQIAQANTVFSPTDEETQWAVRIDEALRQSAASGNGAFAEKDVLIDLAHGKLARSLLVRQAAIDDFERAAHRNASTVSA